MDRPLEPDSVYTPADARRAAQISDQTLEMLASLLDDVFHIPGTRIRFGLDPVVGLVPGLGDVLTGLASFLIVFAAWQRGTPRVTQARMLANIAVDSVLGAIPFFGDAFDVAWKSNRKNLGLLQRDSSLSRGRQEFADWVFLFVIIAVAAAAIALPIAVLVLIVHRLWAA
jgi:hypothetical protein